MDRSDPIDTPIRIFLFRSTVYSAATFVPLLIISALALHSRLQARQGTTR